MDCGLQIKLAVYAHFAETGRHPSPSEIDTAPGSPGTSDRGRRRGRAGGAASCVEQVDTSMASTFDRSSPT